MFKINFERLVYTEWKAKHRRQEESEVQYFDIRCITFPMDVEVVRTLALNAAGLGARKTSS